MVWLSWVTDLQGPLWCSRSMEVQKGVLFTYTTMLWLSVYSVQNKPFVIHIDNSWGYLKKNLISNSLLRKQPRKNHNQIGRIILNHSEHVRNTHIPYETSELFICFRFSLVVLVRRKGTEFLDIIWRKVFLLAIHSHIYERILLPPPPLDHRWFEPGF